MNAALDFLTGPAAGTWVTGIGGDGGTWLAADAGVALVIEGQKRDVEVGTELPDVASGPVSKGAELEYSDAGGQGEVGAFFEGGTAASLLAPEAGEPEFVTGDGTKEGLHFANGAAAIGAELMEKTVFGFLLGDGAGRG